MACNPIFTPRSGSTHARKGNRGKKAGNGMTDMQLVGARAGGKRTVTVGSNGTTRGARPAPIASPNLSGPVNPGGSRIMMQDNSSPAANASGAWAKSIFDPAHARDYGCVGIPDENQAPTSVFSYRTDVVLTGNPTGVTAFKNTYGGNGCWLTNDTSGCTFLDSTDTLKVDSCSISRVLTFAHAVNEPVVVLMGTFNGTYTKNGGAAVTFGAKAITFRIQCIYPQPNTEDVATGRAISSSVTVANVTSWSNIGGYFTGGVLPSSCGDQTHQTSTTVVPTFYYTNDVEQYTTYTGESAAGVYAISRPRTVDGVCRFGKIYQTGEVFLKLGKNTYDLDDNGSGSGGTAAFTCIAQPYQAWDPAYANYYPCAATDWTVRMTWFYNWEVTRGYNQGGQDGAAYDKVSMDAVFGLLDHTQFVFPADANDLAAIVPYLMDLVGEYGPDIANAIGAIGKGAASKIRSILDALFRRGKHAPKQLARSLGRPARVIRSLPVS